jgi:hypothetical protein
MVGNTSKELYTITPKEKELVAKFVRPYAVKSVKYLLCNIEGRVYYYTLRLYKDEKVID